MTHAPAPPDGAPLDPLSLAVYALVLAGTAWATARRPSLGIAILVAVIPFALYRYVGHTTVTLPKIALAGAAIGLALRRASPRPLLGPCALTFGALGAFVVLATAISIAHADFKGPALRETLKALEYLALYAVVAIAASEDFEEPLVRAALAATLACVSALAIAQEVAGAPSGFWLAGHAIPRVAGPLEGPNQLAGWLGILLALVAAHALARPPLRAGRLPSPETLALALGAAAAVMSFSRTGVAAIALALAVAWLATPRRRAGVVRAVGLAAVAGAAVVGARAYVATHGGDALLHFGDLSEADDPGGVGRRSQLWRAAIALWRQHPLWGVGAGDFELEIGRVGPRGVRTHANSLYLQSLVEGGPALLAATLALTAASIARFARGPLREPLVVGALAASAGLAAHQVFDLLVFFPKVGETWWLALALGAARADAAARAPARAAA